MSLHFAVPALITSWIFSPMAEGQSSAPAPRRDLSGIWQPSIGAQGKGAAAMPADGRPEHALPYTPFGLEAFKRNHPSNGPTEVPASEDNDPVHICDPQ